MAKKQGKHDPARVERQGDFSEPGLSPEARIETDVQRVTLDGSGEVGRGHPRVDSPLDQADLEERERRGEARDDANKTPMEELP